MKKQINILSTILLLLAVPASYAMRPKVKHTSRAKFKKRSYVDAFLCNEVLEDDPANMPPAKKHRSFEASSTRNPHEALALYKVATAQWKDLVRMQIFKGESPIAGYSAHMIANQLDVVAGYQDVLRDFMPALELFVEERRYRFKIDRAKIKHWKEGGAWESETLM